MISCSFSQRQGFVTIRRADGVIHELEPDGNTVGNFKDQDGRRVYRQSGLGDQGLIFRFPCAFRAHPVTDSDNIRSLIPI